MRFLHQTTSSICLWCDLLELLEDWSSIGRLNQPLLVLTILAPHLET